MKKIGPYWLCQIIGWFLACLYWVEGMLSCNCISIKNATINTLLTFITGIGITHLFTLIIRKYNLKEEKFPRVVYHVILFTFLIGIALWFVNIFINYYTYKEHYYLEVSKFNSLWNFTIGSFDMFIVFMRISSVWVLSYFLYHLGNRSNKAEKETAELNQLFTESSLNHLKAQVNPHFMFNSLNSVKALISEDPEKARNAVVILADILRNSLNSSSKSIISLKDELDHCRDYLKMEKIRFEERLQYEFIVQDDISGIALPPLSIQTLVENAIKHGLSDSLVGGKISITCLVENESIYASVINDGSIKTHNSNGTGIVNLKKRFEILYPQNFNFSISEENGKVIAKFKIPKEKI